ncbi:protein ABSCISIC ACID-INSENSITIVE 5 [Daucus carota subsp. sativus]|uniref:protein ABSCISIC ACID-INSENSITIVE 5 n=1 Tax=Daucus carota subsp. sativus TaxID=79200 RepID=UPI0007B2D5A0|nr:PREDICTED: protein ABSCISIC ACID-INSENSITIVE 5-like isoform X1 [Daucus carota subsp. sativus]
MSHQQDLNSGEGKKNPGIDIMVDQSEDEVESALRMKDGKQPRSNAFPSPISQSSGYLQALDEFENALTGSGRNYGSMNMDEFLQGIWSTEGNIIQAQNSDIAMPDVVPIISASNNNPLYPSCETSNERGNTAGQMSLKRQGSLIVPPPLGQIRTVEEVWSEINRTQQSINSHDGSEKSYPANEKLTLEDFLVRAGVVREASGRQAQPPPPPLPPQLPQLQPQPLFQIASGIQIGGDNLAACFPGGIGSVSANQLAYSVYGGGVTDNGYGAQSSENMSHVSSDGIGMSQLGRKRNGPGKKVIENRQKKMIKNREAAARSRARKHAYTIELEAEVNHLKVENAYLEHRLAELRTGPMKQYAEADKAEAQARAKAKLGILRRSLSSTF